MCGSSGPGVGPFGRMSDRALGDRLVTVVKPKGERVPSSLRQRGESSVGTLVSFSVLDPSRTDSSVEWTQASDRPGEWG